MATPVLPQRLLDAATLHNGRGLPPVERWNPEYCGEIDMRIARDGRWFYMGTPIVRLPLVRLFSTILRKDDERHVLVTPVERVGIVVEDAPFLAVDMERTETGAGPSLAFRTNLDDIVVVDAAHPLTFEIDGQGGLKPYVLVRGGLRALLSRPLAFELADMLDEDGAGQAGITLGGMRYAVPVETLA